MTDERGADDERAAQVDRQGLAAAVNALMKQHGIRQADLGRAANIHVSTLRKIQKARGTDHYGPDLLERLSLALKCPKDYLHDLFYRVPPNSRPPTDADVALEKMMTRVEPYLAKIEAIEPRLAKIDTIDDRLSAVMDAIHGVNGRIDAALDLWTHPPEDH